VNLGMILFPNLQRKVFRGRWLLLQSELSSSLSWLKANC